MKNRFIRSLLHLSLVSSMLSVKKLCPLGSQSNLSLLLVFKHNNLPDKPTVFLEQAQNNTFQQEIYK